MILGSHVTMILITTAGDPINHFHQTKGGRTSIFLWLLSSRRTILGPQPRNNHALSFPKNKMFGIVYNLLLFGVTATMRKPFGIGNQYKHSETTHANLLVEEISDDEDEDFGLVLVSHASGKGGFVDSDDELNEGEEQSNASSTQLIPTKKEQLALATHQE